MHARVSDLLRTASSDCGEFTFAGAAEMPLTMPGLQVEDDYETRVDEQVRKSWQLDASKVSVTNLQWNKGMDEVKVVVTKRLGYEGILLQCLLYKLLVYGEGGHFAKHKDTEKEDGIIATLVVQLPSVHEGGSLVVYQGSKEHRYDFGKTNGTAVFTNHYVVHTLEQATRGYRVVLAYSICLPPEMCHLKRKQNSESSVQALAGTMQ
uniref:Prolyl 4-hydroxylase alpha subunit Fe(2+) 2OG dioxygenase domain-containing protein n=1 Tax=Globisporangium ultimum (strain ATCC 200006 / CBS 805.95 / DAOM BR144) TaxID=431595 RepID=K3WAI7_GLOUD